MYRNTYVQIDLKALEHNIKTLVRRYRDYDYIFGVVKADCYGHCGNEPVRSVLNGGCNYLAVATLEEALTIRKDFPDTPVLCFSVPHPEDVSVYEEKGITLTITSLECLRQLSASHGRLKAHIKVNSGMNRLGVSTPEELLAVLRIAREKQITVEGIYTHLFRSEDAQVTKRQFEAFETITSGVDLKTIPIVHFGGSDAPELYPKKPYVNGCRLGIVMYNLGSKPIEGMRSTFSLQSEVIHINTVKDDTVGYNGAYLVKGTERIAVVPIGYADGVIRKNTGRSVYIHDKAYPIVGNVCMDMLFVKVDDTVQVGDTVAVIRDADHIRQIAKHLDTIPYEVICSVGKRIPRIYTE